MPKFNLDKKGYNSKEVDDYIHQLSMKYEEKLSEQKDRVFALKNELESANQRLANYVEKDKQISQALMYAVEKADEIESSAKKIYELEIKRIRLLYKRWEELLLEVESKYPQTNNNAYLNELLATFKTSIADVLEQNLKLNKVSNSVTNVKENLKKKSDDYIKNILNKMDYAFHYQTQMDLEDMGMESKPNKSDKELKIKKVDISSVMANHNKEQSRLANITNKLNSSKPQTTQDLVDAYLNSEIDDSFANTAYAKNITRKKITKEDDSPFNYPYPTPNDSGFDLKEALNPKEELDEIMKSFDFFDEDENEN